MTARVWTKFFARIFRRKQLRVTAFCDVSILPEFQHYFSFGWVRYSLLGICWFVTMSYPASSAIYTILYISFSALTWQTLVVIVNWLYYHYCLCETHSIGILNATAKSPQSQIKNQSKFLIQFVPNAETLRRMRTGGHWDASRWICRRSFQVKVSSLL